VKYCKNFSTILSWGEGGGRLIYLVIITFDTTVFNWYDSIHLNPQFIFMFFQRRFKYYEIPTWWQILEVIYNKNFPVCIYREIFVMGRRSGSYFSEGRKAERRSGTSFPCIGIININPLWPNSGSLYAFRKIFLRKTALYKYILIFEIIIWAKEVGSEFSP
jgi:hypothetical protein